MELIVSHLSALDYWRRISVKDAFAKRKFAAIKPAARPSRTVNSHVEKLEGLSKPVHVLVGYNCSHRASQKLRRHISTSEFPRESFIRIANGLTVSSPELCFIQMASELSLIDLIMLGFEFCGSYRMREDLSLGQGFSCDSPLTSVAQLKAYATKAIGLRGRKNALAALRHIADGSASPMETALTMMLSLPYRLGGYGFTMPRLNSPIDISTGAKKASRKSRYYLDLYWPDALVAVEYDSDVWHAITDKISEDARRRNALSSIGVTVINVSRRQINSTAKLREVAEVLGKLLGKRLKCPMPEFTARHALLRSQLLPKVSQDR